MKRKRERWREPWARGLATAVLGCTLGVLPACSGKGGGGGADTDGETDSGTASAGDTDGMVPDEDGVGLMGMRRLSRDEYDNTVFDLLGDDTRPGSQLLPEDVVDPFDNDYTTQQASSVLIEALETLAIDISTRLLAEPDRRDAVVGCIPASWDDQDCLTSFIEGFGKRALRRPLSDDEVTRFRELATTFATMKSDFYEGVDVVLRALLQHPHFVYRVELGSPTNDPRVFRLDDYEVATRLSYFLWGTTPSDELLADADAGELSSAAGARAAAEWMLEDQRARDRVDRFHAMWMGYYRLPHDPELTDAMRTETKRLLEKIVFDDRAPWLDVFLSTGTFVNDLLAEHYGLPAPGSTEHVWVDYGDSARQGLLSHGSFLSVAGKFGDTSPTQRGKLIRTRLLCQNIPPPPPDVNVDEPPVSEDSDCKWDKYSAHRESGTSCKGCHELMDPVGFGLENFDQTGAWRDHDEGFPECTITGDGVIDGQPFNGPAGLANLLVQDGIAETCVVEQAYRMAMGHDPGEDDARYVTDLEAKFMEGGYLFDQLLLDLTADEAFLYRREEVE